MRIGHLHYRFVSHQLAYKVVDKEDTGSDKVDDKGDIRWTIREI